MEYNVMMKPTNDIEASMKERDNYPK